MNKSSDKRLFTNVLGNKLGLLPKLSQHYTTVVEPYGGSAAISLNMPNVEHIYIGETDPIVYAGYTNWLSGNLSIASKFFDDSEATHDLLFDAASIVIQLGHVEILPVVVYKAFLFRQSVFGGVMRLNKKGEINVSIATDKLKRAMKRAIPKSPEADMRVFVDAACTMDTYNKDADTLLVLDPPYYSPGSTPCYPGHNPKDRGETEQAILYLQKGLADGVEVVFSAYLDEELLDFVNEVVAQAVNIGYNVERLSKENLSNLTKATTKGPQSKQDKPQEHVLYFQKLDFDLIQC
jgi:site-specific DNA-adenine methylase